MRVYALYHCNLMFSSIEEEARNEVIERCYWPILRLAEHGHKVSLEATALTLEIIKELDPKWIAQLKELVHSKKIEFVGSGYSQIIGPAVPHAVNQRNFKSGQQLYSEILGITPSIYLVNEMTFSVDLIEIYVQNGIDAIVIDWNNFSKYTKGVHEDYKRKPIKLSDELDNTIKVIWSDSIIFQKFQRYVHGEYSEAYYYDFLKRTVPEYDVFPLYTSDAEIFEYRPGRYKTENALDLNEWQNSYRNIRVCQGKLYPNIPE